MTQLSPAEAIWKAFNDVAESVGVFTDYGDALAAALRALADQVVPYEDCPCHRSVDLWEQRMLTRCRILDCANELEGWA